MAKRISLLSAVIRIVGILSSRAKKGTVLLLGVALSALPPQVAGASVAFTEPGQINQQDQQREQREQQQREQQQRDQQQREQQQRDQQERERQQREQQQREQQERDQQQREQQRREQQERQPQERQQQVSRSPEPDLRRPKCAKDPCKDPEPKPKPIQPQPRPKTCAEGPCQLATPAKLPAKNGAAPNAKAVPTQTCPAGQSWNGIQCTLIGALQCLPGQNAAGSSCQPDCAIATTSAQGVIMRLRLARQRKDEACRQDPTSQDCHMAEAGYDLVLNEYRAFLGSVPLECTSGLMDPSAI